MYFSRTREPQNDPGGTPPSMLWLPRRRLYIQLPMILENCTLSPSPQAYTIITSDTLYTREAQTYFFLLSATAFLEASFTAPLRLFNSTFSIFTGLTRSCSDSHSRDNDQDPTLKTL